MFTSDAAERQSGRAAEVAAWFLVLSVLFGLLLPATLPAQSITGELVEEGSGVAMAGAFVLLLDMSDVEQTRVMTDGQGRFALDVGSDGVYRLRAVAVGRQSWLSDPIAVFGDSTLTISIEMPRLAVVLPAVVVEADRDCRIRPEAGAAATRLWDEARKALEAVVWTERQGTLRYRVAVYNRRLEPGSLDIVEEQVAQRSGVYRGSPFATQSPDSLMREGYVREGSGDDWNFHAPDAAVLLSDPFADVHCFAVTDQGADRSGLIGLAFEPIRDRDVADVEGVLWLDTATAELRYLEYQYTDLPDWYRDVESEHVGGRVDFQQLPEGPWIVVRWWIRVPEVSIRERAMYAPARVVFLALREQGGWVEEVQTLEGQTVWQAPRQ